MQTVNCRDWAPDPTRPRAGVCRAGLYPSPSLGVCRGCDRRRPVDPAADAVAADPEPPAVVRPAEVASFGQLWGEIHAAADPSRTWWLSVVQRLGCNDCRLHTIAYATAHRPPLGDRAAFRRWGWELHNDVRRRQGKPPMGWDEFDRRWPIDGGSTGR